MDNADAIPCDANAVAGLDYALYSTDLLWSRVTAKSSSKSSALRWALALFWISIVLGCIKFALTISYTAPGVSPVVAWGTFLSVYIIMSLLVIYVGMGARWARIALLILCLVAVAPAVPLVIQHFWVMPAAALLTLLQASAQVVGFVVMFRQAMQSSSTDMTA